jgi:hypothetical protein
MEVDQETVSLPNRHDHSKSISYTHVMWQQMTDKNFPEILVRELIIHSQEENVTASGTSRGIPSPNASQHNRLEIKHSQHWPSKEKHAAPLHKQTQSTLYLCRKCDGVCIAKCFEKKCRRLSVSR